jgi:hypothetical protein
MGSVIAPEENPNTHVLHRAHYIYAENNNIMEPIGGIGDIGETTTSHHSPADWRAMAEKLIKDRPELDEEELLHIFDEREAVASLDGGLDDHSAGRTAYETLQNHLKEIQR